MGCCCCCRISGISVWDIQDMQSDWMFCANQIIIINELSCQRSCLRSRGKKIDALAQPYEKIYIIYSRLIIYAMLFVGELVFWENSEILCKIINILIISQSALCVILILIHLKILTSNFYLLALNHQKQKTQLLRQFILVAVFCILRFVININFLLIDTDKDDGCGVEFDSSLWHTVVYLCVGVIATHFIPVLLILRLYNLKVVENGRMSVNYYSSIDDDGEGAGRDRDRDRDRENKVKASNLSGGDSYAA